MAYLMLYLIFQVGIGTFARLMGKDWSKKSGMHISKQDYYTMLIPVFGVFYAFFCVIRMAVKD